MTSALQEPRQVSEPGASREAAAGVVASSRRLLRRWRGRRQIETSSSRGGLALVAVVLVVYFQLDVGGFATTDNAVSILTNVVPMLVAAVAASRLLITGNVDLSIGGSYALLTVVCGSVLSHSNSVVLAIVVTLVAGAALGALNGTLVRVLRISPIIVTLALSFVYTGLALGTTDAQAFFGFPDSFTELGQNHYWGLPLPLIIALVFFAAGGFLLTRTVAGLHSYAIGGNPNACRLTGIKVDRHVLGLFVYMAVSMALVAILTSAQLGSASPSNGVNFELDVLSAVILGGVAFQGGAGRPIGVLVGVTTIGILQAGFVFEGLSDFYQQVAKGSLLLLALGVDQIAAARRTRKRPQGEPARVETVESSELQVMPDHGDAAPGSVVLRAGHLKKSFGAVAAVRDVSFEARTGEVLCLLGDNGAGKSTVIKMISGVTHPDEGEIVLREKSVRFSSPADARAAGIETVYQDLALCPNLGAALNLVLGREPRWRPLRWLGLLDRRACERIARDQLSKLEIKLDDYFRPVADLSGGQRQSIAIARVVIDDVTVVILDEPTAALGVRQTASVLALARRLAQAGAAVIMITHDVETVFKVADRIVVLQLGRMTFEGAASELTTGRLIHLMAGFDESQAARETGSNGSGPAAMPVAEHPPAAPSGA